MSGVSECVCVCLYATYVVFEVLGHFELGIMCTMYHQSNKRL